MTTQHTPGRLTVNPLYPIQIATSKNPIGLVAQAIVEKPYTDQEAVNIARRIVACWNACEGIDTASLESLDAIGGVKALEDHAREKSDALNVMRVQRDELLAALTESRRWIGDGECSDGLAREYRTPDYIKAVDLIDAAIAKVKGGAA